MFPPRLLITRSLRTLHQLSWQVCGQKRTHGASTRCRLVRRSGCRCRNGLRRRASDVKGCVPLNNGAHRSAPQDSRVAELRTRTAYRQRVFGFQAVCVQWPPKMQPGCDPVRATLAHCHDIQTLLRCNAESIGKSQGFKFRAFDTTALNRNGVEARR